MTTLNEFQKYMEKDFIDKETNVFSTDCEIIIKLLDSCEIYLVSENRFFLGVRTPNVKEDLLAARAKRIFHESELDEVSLGAKNLAYTGTYDFGHTNAEWADILSLGIYGLKKRVQKYAEASDESKKIFYEKTILVYDAALRFMERCATFAKKNEKYEMAESLLKLVSAPPSTLYEAMQTSLVYYTLQQTFDTTPLRAMGRLDSLLYPYFVKEERESAKALIYDYLRAFDCIKATANLPFALCGTNEKGEDLTNELSFLFLETYRKAKTSNVKLHLLCAETTPNELITQALEAVREGNNSIVFFSDKKVIESLRKLGASHADAVNYHVVGCYECGSSGELTCSCNARVNIPKALEYALNGGVDLLSGDMVGLPVLSEPATFEELFAEFKRQLIHLSQKAMETTDAWEEQYSKLHASPFLSSTYGSALEKGGDLYCEKTAKYNNSSVNALGLATAADSLYSIKKLVFEDKHFTLSELTDILRCDWKDREALRLQCKNRLAKFGTGNKETDKIAQRIVLVLSNAINGAPNKKGGKYRLGLFSINWRWEFGRRTAASADGRRAGEPLSQNTSAMFGADRQGATAHLLSVASLDTSSTPNGTVVDIDLHRSSVEGTNGLLSMLSSLKTYFDLGGFAVHYNVLDVEILKDAKNNPQKYPHLQVRLCGWNVLFSSLSEREKEEFIMRSMRS